MTGIDILVGVFVAAVIVFAIRQVRSKKSSGGSGSWSGTGAGGGKHSEKGKRGG